MFTRIQPPQTSGSKASEHLHPSHFRLACWQNTTRSRECQQNKLYKSWNIHIQETLWCSWAYIQPRKASFKKTTLNVAVNASEIILYLHSQRRALFFPLWVDWRNFLTPSTEGSGLSSLYICTSFFFCGSRTAKRSAAVGDYTQQIPTEVLRTGALRQTEPSIYFLLSFIPDCKFMRILLSFQLWLLPPLDEEKGGRKKKRASDRRWGLESFYYLRITDFPCVGRKTWTTVAVKQWRLRWSSNQCACAFLFRYFNLVMPRKKTKKLYSTRVCNTLVSKEGSRNPQEGT